MKISFWKWEWKDGNDDQCKIQLSFEKGSTPTSLSHPWNITNIFWVETLSSISWRRKQTYKGQQKCKKINTIIKTCSLQLCGCLLVFFLAQPTLHSSKMLPASISEEFSCPQYPPLNNTSKTDWMDGSPGTVLKRILPPDIYKKYPLTDPLLIKNGASSHLKRSSIEKCFRLPNVHRTAILSCHTGTQAPRKDNLWTEELVNMVNLVHLVHWCPPGEKCKQISDFQY